MYLIFFIFILILEITISTILKQFNDYNQQWDYYLSPNSTTSFSKIVYDFLSFTILYNYIVPISLYVTVGNYFFFLLIIVIYKLIFFLFKKFYFKFLQNCKNFWAHYFSTGTQKCTTSATISRLW